MNSNTRILFSMTFRYDTHRSDLPLDLAFQYVPQDHEFLVRPITRGIEVNKQTNKLQTEKQLKKEKYIYEQTTSYCITEKITLL